MKMLYYFMFQVIGFCIGWVYADEILEYMSIPVLVIAVVTCFMAGYYSRKVWP